MSDRRRPTGARPPGRSAPARGSTRNTQTRGAQPKRAASGAGRASAPAKRGAGKKRPPANYEKRRGRGAKMLRDWGEALVVALFFVFVMYLVFWPVRYDGMAMEPAIRSGDRVFISRAASWLNRLNHGDIVIYTHTTMDALGREQRVDSVARIIGMPWDRISISGGIVFRNGLPVEEPYLQQGMTTHPEMEAVSLGATQFFLMVDNRFAGGDSRDFGVVERSDINARALVRFMSIR